MLKLGPLDLCGEGCSIGVIFNFVVENIDEKEKWPHNEVGECNAFEKSCTPTPPSLMVCF